MPIINVFPFVVQVFAAPINWFTALLSSIPGSEGIMIAVFFMLMLISFLIMPIRGTLSDRAVSTFERQAKAEFGRGGKRSSSSKKSSGGK